jgi:hypothetical protein
MCTDLNIFIIIVANCLAASMTHNGQVQVFGPDAFDLFSTYCKIFCVIKYMNLPPKPG